MTLETWQIVLRREFGREQNFKLKNTDEDLTFGDFEVTNPETERTYRVAIRGEDFGCNYCSCPDFAVNTLGTCKHIEFALAKLRRKRGAKKRFAEGFNPPYSEVFLRYGPKREIVFRPGEECPESLTQLAGRYFDPAGLLRPNAYGRFHVFLKKALTGEHEVRCYDDALIFISQVRDTEELASRIDTAFPSGATEAAFKKLLKVPLYPYQRKGALFAARNGRCLIADDMGLGKTIQAIASVEILARVAGIERVLVVSPTSLKHQWQSEIEKFSDRSAMVIQGLLARRAELYAADSFYKLTNYDVIFRDLDLIRRWQPDLIILDEAQRIKNWKTRTARSVKQLESDFAFVLTGTPLENRLEELHSIVEFIDRFRLGPMFRFLAAHQHVNENGRVIGYRDLSRISETLKPILIRRTKETVLKELPERLEKRFFVQMTDEQWKHHDENREIVARLVAKWKRYGFLSEIDQRRLLIALQNMRMSCNSTYLLDKKTDYGYKADEVADLLADIMEDPNTKVVIFSQWVRMHELIAARADKRKWDYVFFHGGVPSRKRKDLIQRFRDDPSCRLFLSTDAGGVGLNLQNASVVINMDQPWNPAVLEQRVGRVHRIGQRLPVRVIHFIAEKTIEEGMLSLLSFKQSMFAGVLDGGQDEVFLGGTRLSRFMNTVEKATAGIPEPAPPAPKPEPGEAELISARECIEVASPTTRAQPASPQEQLLGEIISAGATLLEKLTQAASAGRARQPSSRSATEGGGIIAHDEKTGQPYLKLPLPGPDTMKKIADLFSRFAQGR
ncbi:MAG: DEAD/DEAH box helicase [Planctomycetes bacterium]|nr:DEAD/DEAH box helicase [Planctomycetota bacterium]